LVGRDRVEPWPKASPFLELFLLQIDLQKGRLEDVLGHLRAAEIPTQVAEKLPLVTMHEEFVGTGILRQPKLVQQILIRGDRRIHAASQASTGRNAGLCP
jgi:hypothetical protein